MPYALAVHPPDRLGEVRLSGRVTGQEIAAAARELAGRPDWVRDYRVIWDTTDQTGLAVEVETFEEIIEQERDLRTVGESGELVFVVTDEVWAGLVTLFKTKMREAARPVTVVRTLAEARAHLGVGAE